MKQYSKHSNFVSVGELVVSKMITQEGKKPMFIYRQKRSGKKDSGWRIFSGFEDDKYVNNPDNIEICDSSVIVKIAPSIESLLKTGVGSVFERKNENSTWYRVWDFDLGDDFEVTYKLTEKWKLTINNLFEKEDSGEDLLYTTGDKSVRIAIWNFSNQSKEEIYKFHKKDIETKSTLEILKFYELSDKSILRLGYKIKEEDDYKQYSVIYGFSIIDFEVLQLAFYFDNENDEDWAIETWKNFKTE